MLHQQLSNSRNSAVLMLVVTVGMDQPATVCVVAKAGRDCLMGFSQRQGYLRGNMARLYAYEKCDSCRRALKFLAAHGVKAEIIPIREQPPTKVELQRMLKILGGEVRKLFNTSGLDYKALGLKDKLPGMSATAAIGLLSKNGNLVKRPFLLTKASGTVGFKEETWQELLET